jgi:hypothetical protein
MFKTVNPENSELCDPDLRTLLVFKTQHSNKHYSTNRVGVFKTSIGKKNFRPPPFPAGFSEAPIFKWGTFYGYVRVQRSRHILSFFIRSKVNHFSVFISRFLSQEYSHWTLQILEDFCLWQTLKF